MTRPETATGLRQRLSLSFLLVAVLVVTLTTVCILAAGSVLFAQYLRTSLIRGHQRIIIALERGYTIYGSWEAFREDLGFVGMLAGADFVVRDTEGLIVLESWRYAGMRHGGRGPGMGMGLGMGRMSQGGPPGPIGPGPGRDVMESPRLWRQPLRMTRREAVYPLVASGRRVGTVTFALPVASGLLELESNFRRMVLLAALLAALAAAVIGWASGTWLASRLTQPLLALRAAARRFAAGQLDARVELTGGQGRVAAEVAELGHSFNLMAERLEQLEKMRRQLTADVAHELRTPVAAARNLVEAFQDGVLAPDETNLSQLSHELERLGRLIGDLRDLSVAESGQLQLARERLDLREVADAAAGGWRSQFAGAGLAFTVNLPAEPLPVVGDADALGRAVGNLLANALRYTPRGGAVAMSLAREEALAVLKVSDTGQGIPEAELPLIFERFFRGEKARESAAEGTGIGLAIVREVTEAHGGEVLVASRLGEGTTFTLRFPLAPA